MSAVIRTINSLNEIAGEDWDRCANPASRVYNPFISFAFLHALEISGSATAETGWHGCHILLEDEAGNLEGVMPCYLKPHSSGEYVFDYGWAEAYERAGGRYYPKMQSSVPFSPVTGPRFLVPDCDNPVQRKRFLAEGAKLACEKLHASSVHITFLPEEDWREIADDGWLRRTDTQFHWHNNGYETFDDFLANLSSRKRKNIIRERRIANSHDLTIERLTGTGIKERHWDAFYRFYLETGSRKWGTPYLNRQFFSLIGEAIPDDIMLVMISRDDHLIAGALNMIGGDTLFGRNWGAIEHYDCLHFEACYYQAIEFAIERGLACVEAGAQGPHKLARGYLPKTTYSLHYLADPRFARAVEDYLEHERSAVAQDGKFLRAHSPFRKNDGDTDG